MMRARRSKFFLGLVLGLFPPRPPFHLLPVSKTSNSSHFPILVDFIAFLALDRSFFCEVL